MVPKGGGESDSALAFSRGDPGPKLRGSGTARARARAKSAGSAETKQLLSVALQQLVSRTAVVLTGDAPDATASTAEARSTARRKTMLGQYIEFYVKTGTGQEIGFVGSQNSMNGHVNWKESMEGKENA